VHDVARQAFVGFVELGRLLAKALAGDGKLEGQSQGVKRIEGVEKLGRVLVILPALVPNDAQRGFRRLLQRARRRRSNPTGSTRLRACKAGIISRWL
jgi:hypothetical protein